MIFIWGKKLVFTKLGFVADFCPMCRSPQMFKMQSVGVASHVYYVSFGRGELAGYQRECANCGVALDAKPSTYAGISEQQRPLPQLLMGTFPNFDTAYGRVLALEERVRHAPASLTREERRALIRTPFALMSAKVEKRYARTHIDLYALVTFLAAVLAVCGGIELLRRIAPDYLDAGALAMGAAGLVVVGWQTALSNRRYIRRAIVPDIARTLKPLQPSKDEIADALAELAALHHKIGKKLDTDDLMAALA